MDSKKCLVCWNPFGNKRLNGSTKYTKAKWETAKFCSYACRCEYQIWKRSNREWTWQKKSCSVCWKEYKKYWRTKEQFEDSKFCSVKCLSISKIWISRPDNIERMKENRRTFKGEDHWNWKWWITPENHAIRRSKEYEEWRRSVYSRDGFKCTECGNKKNIVAHHVKCFHSFPNLRFSLENGITLCRACHLKIHRRVK